MSPAAITTQLNSANSPQPQHCDSPFYPFSPPPSPAMAEAPAIVYNPAPSSHTSSSHIYVPLIASVRGALLLGLGLLGAICFSRKRQSKPETIKPDAIKPDRGDAEGLEIESSLLSNMLELPVSDRLIRFSFKELQEATDNFSGAHRIKNSVFHAVLRGNRVAIKQMRGQVSKEINALHRSMRGQVSEEINALHRFYHTSLNTLLGICVEESSDQDSGLVPRLRVGRNLSDYIHSARSHAGGSNLSWNQRLQIALDIEGLEYLHHSTTTTRVHKDLNSHNILLDKNFQAKIANFGLAKC